MTARQRLAAAAAALLDERRQLGSEELARLAELAPESVPALASLAHEVRLAWCGPLSPGSGASTFTSSAASKKA